MGDGPLNDVKSIAIFFRENVLTKKIREFIFHNVLKRKKKNHQNRIKKMYAPKKCRKKNSKKKKLGNFSTFFSSVRLEKMKLI